MSKCRCRQHWRYTYINKLLLLPLGHTGQAVVLSREVSFQPRERGDHNVLHLSPLCPAAGRRKAEAPDAAPRPHPWWEDVALIKLTMGDLKEEVVYWFTHIPPSRSPPLKKKNPNPIVQKEGHLSARAWRPLHEITNTQDTRSPSEFQTPGVFFRNDVFLWVNGCGRVTSSSFMVPKYEGICVAFGNVGMGRGRGPAKEDSLKEKAQKDAKPQCIRTMKEILSSR